MTTQLPKPGLYEDMPYQALGLEVGSYSLLKEVAEKSPWHGLQYKEVGRPDTPALRFGRLLDTLIFKPETFSEQFELVTWPEGWKTTEAGRPEKRTKEAKEWYAQRDPIRDVWPDEYEDAKAHAAGLLESQWFQNALNNAAHIQPRVFWEGPGGLLMQAEFDLVFYDEYDRPVVVDLKTADDASPRAFRNAALWRFRYDIQRAAYLDAVKAIRNDDARFVFVVSEKGSYKTAVYEPTSTDWDRGVRDYERAAVEWAQCLEAGEFPAFPDWQEI